MRARKRDKKPKWYGVKTLYRWVAVGRPAGKDRLYSASFTLVEERVVLIQARTFDEAIRKAEREAQRYCTHRYRNPYGQRVKFRALSYVNASIIDSRPGHAAELFSVTEVVPRSVSDRAVAQRLIGRQEPGVVAATRRNIADIVFSRPAPGVELSPEEQRLVESFSRTLRRITTRRTRRRAARSARTSSALSQAAGDRER